jgi:hypothetical protein
VQISMPMSKTTSSSSCMVATILEGVSCYDLAPIYFFFHHVPCYIISFTSPSAYHLPLTTCSSPYKPPFTKPRTVLQSTHLFLSTFLTNFPCLLTKHLTLLPIPYQPPPTLTNS